jgi:hypothetical protein
MMRLQSPRGFKARIFNGSRHAIMKENSFLNIASSRKVQGPNLTVKLTILNSWNPVNPVRCSQDVPYLFCGKIK